MSFKRFKILSRLALASIKQNPRRITEGASHHVKYLSSIKIRSATSFGELFPFRVLIRHWFLLSVLSHVTVCSVFKRQSGRLYLYLGLSTHGKGVGRDDARKDVDLTRVFMASASCHAHERLSTSAHREYIQSCAVVPTYCVYAHAVFMRKGQREGERREKEP